MELEKKVEELQKQIDQSEKKQEITQNEEIAKEKEEIKPISIKIMDPNSKEVVKTIIPEEMGYGVDNEKYRKEIMEWAKLIARGSKTVRGYDQKMIPDRIGENGQIVTGAPRVILEEKELTEIITSVSHLGGVIELPLYTTHSGYKPEDLPYLEEKLVASFTTYYNTKVAGRSKNIELSANAINNVILGVNDIFSFNTTVGPSDAAHGYQPAEEAVNGKLVMGIGGGICQTSSTLFNAIDQLKVQYVEKHHHSVNVGYVPKGRDATVSYGGVDFQFKNTTGVPLLLKTYFTNGSLTVEVRTSTAYQAQLKK